MPPALGRARLLRQAAPIGVGPVVPQDRGCRKGEASAALRGVAVWVRPIVCRAEPGSSFPGERGWERSGRGVQLSSSASCCGTAWCIAGLECEGTATSGKEGFVAGGGLHPEDGNVLYSFKVYVVDIKTSSSGVTSLGSSGKNCLEREGGNRKATHSFLGGLCINLR